eukprot:9307277-Pyramimonas_sp.AAC.1
MVSTPLFARLAISSTCRTDVANAQGSGDHRFITCLIIIKVNTISLHGKMSCHTLKPKFIQSTNTNTAVHAHSLEHPHMRGTSARAQTEHALRELR